MVEAARSAAEDHRLGTSFWAEAGQILGGAWAGQSWSDAGGFGEIWSDAGQMRLILARFPFLAKSGFFEG